MATREDLLVELQKLKDEKFEIEKWTVNKRGKKHMAPRLKEVNNDIRHIEAELALSNEDRRESQYERQSQSKKKKVELVVGDTLPHGFSYQESCPHCGSEGQVCENPSCPKRKAESDE